MKGRLVNWLGRAFAVATVIYLAVAIHGQWSRIRDWRPTAEDLLALVGAGVVYGLAFMLVAESWHRLISEAAAKRLDRRVTLPSSGVTQLAKYLPGNVMHFVGRHAWLARVGTPHGAIVRATAWEIGCTALAAALTACALAALFPPNLEPMLEAGAVRILALAGVAVIGIGAVTFCWLRGRWAALARWTPAPLVGASAIAILTGFFLVQGMMLTLVINLVGGRATFEILPIAVGAWLIGYVTPGAPGGLGTREAALSLLLAPSQGASAALLATVLFRAVTTLGDIVCFLISSLIAASGGGRYKETEPAL